MHFFFFEFEELGASDSILTDFLYSLWFPS